MASRSSLFVAGAGAGTEDYHENHPMMVPDFQRKFFFRVYGCICVQFFLVALISVSFINSDNLKAELHGNTSVAYSFIFLAALFYFALYIKSWNHPEKNQITAIMQSLFTLFLALCVALVATTFQLYSLVYAAGLISLTCFVIGLTYRFTSMQCHTVHNVRLFFYAQSLFVGIAMYVIIGSDREQYRKSQLIRHVLDGFIISQLVIIYFCYGAARLAACRGFRVTLHNFIIGVTLIYTTGIIKIYYK